MKNCCRRPTITKHQAARISVGPWRWKPMLLRAVESGRRRDEDWPQRDPEAPLGAFGQRLAELCAKADALLRVRRRRASRK